MPIMMKKIRSKQQIDLEVRCRWLIFCCANTAASVVQGALIFDVSTWTCPCAGRPAAPVLPGSCRGLLGRDAERATVTGSSTMPRRPGHASPWGGGEQGAIMAC